MLCKYKKNKLFFLLTLSLVLPIFVITRESNYPLIIDISLMRKLFLHGYSEKHFYNISISYIAAYIFYVFQTFIPQTYNNHHAINGLREDIISELKLLKEFLFIINYSIEKVDDNNTIYLKKNISHIYIMITDHQEEYLKRFTFNLTLETAIEKFETVINRIYSSAYFAGLDSYISNLLSDIPFEEFYRLLRFIASSQESRDRCIIKNPEILTIINNTINSIEQIKAFRVNFICAEATDASLKRKYEKHFNEYSKANEFLFSLPMSL